MDYCPEFQASRQDAIRGRRVWSRISCRDPFLVHGDCHVSKKANRKEVVIDRVGGRDPDGLADWSLHLVVHA